MESIFTKIINNQVEAYVIDKTENFITILAKDQITHGHTLVIPIVPVGNFTKMNSSDYGNLQIYAQKIAKVLELAFPNKKRIVLNIVGFEIDHVHIHLIPCDSIAEAFGSVPEVLDQLTMIQIRNKIQAKLTSKNLQER